MNPLSKPWKAPLKKLKNWLNLNDLEDKLTDVVMDWVLHPMRIHKIMYWFKSCPQTSKVIHRTDKLIHRLNQIGRHLAQDGSFLNAVFRLEYAILFCFLSFLAVSCIWSYEDLQFRLVCIFKPIDHFVHYAASDTFHLLVLIFCVSALQCHH